MLFLEHDFAKSMLYNDLDEEQADHWAHLLKGQSDGYYRLLLEALRVSKLTTFLESMILLSITKLTKRFPLATC